MTVLVDGVSRIDLLGVHDLTGDEIRREILEEVGQVAGVGAVRDRLSYPRQ
jgi:hypothetical protein